MDLYQMKTDDEIRAQLLVIERNAWNALASGSFKMFACEAENWRESAHKLYPPLENPFAGLLEIGKLKLEGRL